MHRNDIANLTPHDDPNKLLANLADHLPIILGEQLVGFYLTGSLTYGDFDIGSSDIDYLVVMDREIDAAQRIALIDVHADIGERYPVWRERIEGSYVTLSMLSNILPPSQGRPYVNQGAFWDPDPPYGNEWLLNLYVLHESGVAILGPEPHDLIGPVQIDDVREASYRDLVEDWMPRLDDPAFPPDSHHEAFVTLTVCRILHRAVHDEVASKRVAAAWVKDRYGEPWRSLIERAEQWRYGEEMHAADEVRAFIRFAQGELES